MLEWLEGWLEYSTGWFVLALVSSHCPIEGKLWLITLSIVCINR